MGMVLVTGQTCDRDTTTIAKPSLSVQMVQVNNYINFNFDAGKALDRGSQVDVNNINWSWLVRDKGVRSLKENTHFGARFLLEYPQGQAIRENVVLVLIVSSKKIPELGIITEGYNFIEKVKATIREEEVDIYKYDYGALRPGNRDIIIGGKTGTIGIDTEDKTPIIIRLIDDSDINNHFLQDTVNIIINRQ